jgi:hypothetical protein
MSVESIIVYTCVNASCMGADFKTTSVHSFSGNTHPIQSLILFPDRGSIAGMVDALCIPQRSGAKKRVQQWQPSLGSVGATLSQPCQAICLYVRIGKIDLLRRAGGNL